MTISITDRILALQQWQNDQMQTLLGNSSKTSSSSGTTFNASAADAMGDYGMSQVVEAFAQKRELYTEQLSELGKFRSAIDGMEEKAAALKGVTTDSSADDIKAAAKKFISEYNAYVNTFAADFQKGGLLADIQNAQIAKFSMERDAGSVFNGAGSIGFGGLANAGITQNKDGTLTMDEAAFDKALSSNKKGVVAGLNDLGTNMEATAKMLVSDGKFLDNIQNKYKDALTWIDQNDPSNNKTNSALSLYASVAKMN